MRVAGGCVPRFPRVHHLDRAAGTGKHQGCREACGPASDDQDVVWRLIAFGDVADEWIKLLSPRSTWWLLASTAALMTLVLFAAAMSLDVMAGDPVMTPALDEMHGADVISGGIQVAWITISVLGALFITGEYSTGMIRSTFAVGVTLSYLVTMPQLSQYDLVPALDDPGTWRVLGGTVFFLNAAALFTLGIGTLLRSTPRGGLGAGPCHAGVSCRGIGRSSFTPLASRNTSSEHSARTKTTTSPGLTVAASPGARNCRATSTR